MHCFTPSDVEYLRTPPLRSFSHGDIALIATKLISTLGGPADVAYFTPRIVEALAEGALIDLVPFAERLAKMPPDLWTNGRVAALAETFRLLFAATEGTWDDLGMGDTRDQLRRVIPRLLEGAG
jgi:hypothetical protein